MRANFPQLQIGDKIKVTGGKEYQIYELDDIAEWKIAKSIKTVHFSQIDDKETETKFTLKHQDTLLISTENDTKPYQVIVNLVYGDKDRMNTAHFNKMGGSFIPIR